MKEVYRIFAEEAIKELCPKYKFHFLRKNVKDLGGVTHVREFKIFINWFFLEKCAVNQREEFLFILFHEIAHGMTPQDGHNHVFEKTFRELRELYGIRSRSEFRK